MNDRQKENASRIALYLENRLSPEESEAFKRALGEDDELRIQYVDALMNRAGTGPTFGMTAEPLAGTEDPDGSGGPAEDTPAEDTFEKEMSVMDTTGAAGIDEPEEYHETPAKGSFWGSGWMVGVVTLLLIIAGVAMFIMIRGGGFLGRTVAATAADSSTVNKGNGVDSAAVSAGNRQVDSAVSGTGGKSAFTENIYTRLYKPYMRGDDPVEVRVYYQDYRTGNYAAVLAAGDSAVKVGGPRAVLVRDYMRLYVGLSYLATGDGRNAVSELGDVVFRTNPGDELYETGQWYLALAWLKRNDVEATEAENKALGLAREIARGYSRYREPAMELVRALEQ